MFTTWVFWVGAAWGAALGVLVVWHWLVKPMALLLGLERGSPETREK